MMSSSSSSFLANLDLVVCLLGGWYAVPQLEVRVEKSFSLSEHDPSLRISMSLDDEASSSSVFSCCFFLETLALLAFLGMDLSSLSFQHFSRVFISLINHYRIYNLSHFFPCTSGGKVFSPCILYYVQAFGP